MAVAPATMLEVGPGDDEAVARVEQLRRAAAGPDSDVELENRLALPALMNGLSELERRAVVMRFFQDLEQTQIGLSSATPRCTSPGCCAAPWPRCESSWRPSPPPGGYWPGWDRLALASS